MDRTPPVVKMHPPASTYSVAAPAGDCPPPRRGLHQPEHPPGVRQSAPPPRRLARGPGARGRDPGRLPRRAPRAGESALKRVDGGGRGVASEPASPASRARPGNGRPGSWRATGGPLAIAAGARRARRVGGPGRRPRHLRAGVDDRRGCRPGRVPRGVPRAGPFAGRARIAAGGAGVCESTTTGQG